ncbi:sugar transferase [Pseudalkalibacillus hwajinpoensis]|uniref:sugar transferase n=1 Tax=Guptibacillus hwajinpoensis TaxID=208199 RepID=UPI0024B35263|nr:sugar transferase [Pseudalkalibacillus hwajinpoensis]
MLLPLLGIFFLVGILIKIEDGGPIFYGGERLGKDKKKFKMYKFRSMKVNAPDLRNDDGSTFNSSSDKRLTRIGKYLRETSVDEIPQLINVLKGDMSIIGPRASLGNSLSTYKEDELEKMKVRPGITGYTQAYYRNGLTMREKRLYDVWYANHLNFLLDIKIFFKTVSTVIFKKGLYSNRDTN